MQEEAARIAAWLDEQDQDGGEFGAALLRGQEEMTEMINHLVLISVGGGGANCHQGTRSAARKHWEERVRIHHPKEYREKSARGKNACWLAGASLAARAKPRTVVELAHSVLCEQEEIKRWDRNAEQRQTEEEALFRFLIASAADAAVAAGEELEFSRSTREQGPLGTTIGSLMGLAGRAALSWLRSSSGEQGKISEAHWGEQVMKAWRELSLPTGLNRSFGGRGDHEVEEHLVSSAGGQMCSMVAAMDRDLSEALGERLELFALEGWLRAEGHDSNLLPNALEATSAVAGLEVADERLLLPSERAKLRKWKQRRTGRPFSAEVQRLLTRLNHPLLKILQPPQEIKTSTTRLTPPIQPMAQINDAKVSQQNLIASDRTDAIGDAWPPPTDGIQRFSQQRNMEGEGK